MRCKKIDRFVLNPGAISGRDLIESKIHKQKIHLKIIAFIDSEVQKKSLSSADTKHLSSVQRK